MPGARWKVSTARNESKLPPRHSPRGRPRKFSEELLVDAALRVMGRDGYTSLTVRSLAEELGVSHSALYTYVGAVEEIEEKAKRQLTDQLPRPQAHSAPELRKELLAYLLAARKLLLLHPGVVLSRAGSASSEIFRENSEQWHRALLPHAPDFKTLQLALAALVGTVLLFVEGERLLVTDPARKGRRLMDKEPFEGSLPQRQVEQYLSDLMDLVLPGLASAKGEGRKPARRRSSK